MIAQLLLFFTLVTMTLHAEAISYKIIFGVDKNETIVKHNLAFTKKLFEKNIEVQTLQKRNNLSFDIVSYGDYKVIEFAPIEKLHTQQSLILFLKPYFTDLFVINSEHSDKKEKKIYQPLVVDYHAKQTTAALEIMEKLEDEDMVDKLLNMQYWLEQRHVLIIILLLGGFFFYRKFKKLQIMKEQQTELSNEQDSIEIKLNK